MAKQIPNIYIYRAKNAQHDEYMVDTQEEAPGQNPNPEPTPGEGNGENEDEYTPPDNDGGFGK